ncbi:DUF167 domain-containing protein [Hymenobacter sp. BT186]|uniref:UPF0235 protein J0X19_05960 n=1 Tax=Hymenobacter telluris TaxID=2816474 RepID=A0A939EUJ6_9BACT|nr:DUF167 domain-containing protein [Hymenobacter telluris]MBO0357482.1 DUF167 domain-containing protein [Hymenobacter telluris]MBW3373508.1 DUF167 domain-containing protein [Hymenobacter norwichensis]
MPVFLHLKAKPNARANQLLLAPDGTLTVRLKAPAQDGKANACLVAYLAQVFGVSKSAVVLLSGHTTPFKKVEINGVEENTFQAVLQQVAAR